MNRFKNTGVCRAGAEIRVSSVNLHYGEEPPISGKRGSGTIFLSHCNLRCLYCQNFPISQQGVGNKYSINELVEAMLSLQNRSAHNINLVAPSHYAVQLHRAVIIARERGLTIPIVYNSSGYDSPEQLELWNGHIEIYMPDLRYWDNDSAEKYSGANDYPEISRNAVKIMHSQVGDLVMDENGIAQKGVLIRLLVLPQKISGTVQTLRWIAENLGTNVYLSVMSQYFPAYKAHDEPPLDRQIFAGEYIEVLETLDDLGFERGYIQPVPSGDEDG